MTGATVTAGASAAHSGSRRGRCDAPPARRWASGEEVYELVRQAHDVHSDKRWQRNVGNHCADLYDVLRKRDAVETRRFELAGRDGYHRFTYTQIARDLYDDVQSYREGGIAKHSSIGRWLTRLRDAGLIEWRGVQGHFLEVKLLEVPEAAPGYADAVRPHSSAGSSGEVCGARRRRETRSQRRAAMVRPYCRRSGQKGAGRYEPAPFSALDASLVTPGLVGPPRGGPSSRKWQTRLGVNEIRVAAVAPRLRSALAACPPTARASLVELWSRNGAGTAGGRRLGAAQVDPGELLAAVPAGCPVEAALLFWWTLRCPGRPPLLSREACGRLRRHAGQLDRLHGPGTGLDELARAAAHVFAGQDFDQAADVVSAAYLIRAVKLAARDAVRRDRVRRGVRRNGRGRSGPQTGTWKSRTGEDACL